MGLIKEEIWSVPLERAQDFFRSQSGVTEEGELFRYNSAVIKLEELDPRDMGIWSARRVRLHIKGGDSDVETIYRRFFIQFLTAGA